LTLFVIPAVYSMAGQRLDRRADVAGPTLQPAAGE
jgi:hypothetical protein